jgi:hypothetical protein
VGLGQRQGISESGSPDFRRQGISDSGLRSKRTELVGLAGVGSMTKSSAEAKLISSSSIHSFALTSS